MAYTLLKMTERGMVLRDYHARRFPDPEAFFRATQNLSPGVWAVSLENGAWETTPRAGSRLKDGMPSRWVTSPVAHLTQPISKPHPPGPYHAVRVDGVATGLTCAKRHEIFEFCSAAVIGWDGSEFLMVSKDRPRVQSVAEMAIREHLPFKERPLCVQEDLPLILVNAVKGPCAIHLPDRPPFPQKSRQTIENLFSKLTLKVGL